MDPKSLAKSFLKALRLYHPLQATFRTSIEYLQKLGWRRRYAQFGGSGFSCNFCGAAYERFVPEYPSADIGRGLSANGVIAGYGENVFCPRCGSKNRERLVKAVLSGIMDIRGKKILHFSPERQLHRWLASNADVTTVDLEPGFYRAVDRSVRFADATSLGFPSFEFDIVIANHVMEHIPDDAAAMKEIARVLKPGGLAILQVPFSPTLASTIEDRSITDPAQRTRMFGQRDHVRVYALNDYVRRLNTAGFLTQVIGPGELASYRDHAIQEGEVVFLCRKA